MSRTGQTEGRQGIALVEVLVAVVIFFAAFAALLRVYALAVAALDASERTVASTLTAQQQLESMPLAVTNTAGGGGAAGVEAVQGYVCAVDSHAVSGASLALTESELRAGRRGSDADVVVWTRTVSAAP